MADDIIVRLIGLPCKVNGFTVLDEDGNYNIYINEILSAEGQRTTLMHEIAHIKGNHFYLDCPLALKEMEAHNAEKGNQSQR